MKSSPSTSIGEIRASRIVGRAYHPVPDNIYRPNDSGVLAQVKNVAHDESNINNDLSGGNVLLGRRFWYFGSSSPRPARKSEAPEALFRGHSVHINRRGGDVNVRELESWLRANSLRNSWRAYRRDGRTDGLALKFQTAPMFSSAETTRAVGCSPRLTGAPQLASLEASAGDDIEMDRPTLSDAPERPAISSEIP